MAGGNIAEPTTPTFLWALCFPASCNASILERLINDVLANVNINFNMTLPNVALSEESCSVATPKEWDALDITAGVLFGLVAIMMIISTAFDLYTHGDSKSTSRCHELIKSFSVYTNSSKLIKTNKSSSTLGCVHGVRVLSMLWVILGHRYIMYVMTPLTNITDPLEWLKTYPSAIIVGATVSVDTFFVLSGLLLSYVFFTQYEKKKQFNVLLFYVHRLVRLWPAMAAAVLAQATFFRHSGDGPFWSPISEALKTSCRESWWSALIFLQNYVKKNGLCVPQLWYLYVDTQLYFLSPLLLFPLCKNKRIGVVWLAFCITAAQITTAYVSFSNKWSATMLKNNITYQDEYYAATHARAVPWLLGFAAGYFLFLIKNAEIKISKVIVCFCWIISVAMTTLIVFGFKPLYAFEHEISYLEDGSYNAFARTGWAVAVIWIIFACVKGYGGPVNWFLSLKMWEVLGRFTYSLYLTHFGIQLWKAASAKTTEHFSHSSLIYTYCGDIMIGSFVTYLCVLAFESPFIAIEKTLLKRPNASRENKDNDVNIQYHQNK